MLTLQRIEEIVGGIDSYLQKLHSFSEELREIKHTLLHIKNSKEEQYMWELQKLRIETGIVRKELEKYGLPLISEYELSYNNIKEMILSEEWPKAVDPRVICNTEEMVITRANDILEFIIGENLQNKKFLDFGCGEGHVIMQSLNQNPSFALGYDINPSKIKFENQHFTSEFDVVKINGPYDVVLMQDCIDHLILGNTESIVGILTKIKDLLSQNGRLYIRCHPWCSRHGTHLYTKLNKAYVHLVFDESELSRLGGYSNDHTIKITNVSETYRSWFRDAGFNIISEININKNLEEFFKKQSFIKDRLLKTWKGNETQMYKDMQIEFIEFTLQANNTEKTII